MEFTNNFHIPLPIDEAWKLMLDVPRILPCLPGAKLTEVLGNNKYKGSVSVKLGPIKLSFDGQAELVRQDDEKHIAWLQGAGLDPKGRGSAQSEFSFALTPAAGGGTECMVTTQLQLAGAVAQYGRGSGMIAEVAGHILKQFEENLAESLQGNPGDLETPPAALGASPLPLDAGSTPSSAAAASGTPAMSPMRVGSSDAQTLLFQAQALLGQSQAVLAATQQALLQFKAVSAVAQKKKKPKELNMLAIGTKALWSQTKQSLGRLFRS